MKSLFNKALTIIVFAMIGLFLLTWCVIEIDGTADAAEKLIRLGMFVFLAIAFIAIAREAWRSL